MTVANILDPVLRPLFDGPLPLGLRAWDGSELAADDPAAPTVVLHSPNALRRLIWSPGEIGLARAYVTGDLDVDGDLADGFRRVRAAVRDGGLSARIGPSTIVKAVVAAYRLGAIGRPLSPPASEARPRGRLHSKRRDAAVISHHYDLSNALYTLLLDEHMAPP